MNVRVVQQKKTSQISKTWFLPAKTESIVPKIGNESGPG